MRNLLFSAVALALLAPACDVEQLDVSYLYVPRFEVVLEPGQGAVSEDINEVRVVLGAQSLGFYPVPGRIPILENGERLVRLEPVVRISGVATQRVVYPQYEAFEETLTLVPGQTDTIVPRVSYLETVELLVVEDFNATVGLLNVDLDGDDATELTTVTDPLDPSRRVATAVFTEENPVLEVVTPPLTPPAQQASEIWLELDYRGDVQLNVALIPAEFESRDSRSLRYLTGALPRDDWQKFYFQVGDELSARIVDQPFRLSLLSAFDPRIEGGEQRIFIDNAKLVYR